MKRMKLFKGVGVALITPFDGKGNIDEKSLRNLVEYNIKNGVDFLTILGTTAETATMSCDEQNHVVKIIANQCKKRVKLLIGIGGNNTKAVIEQIKTSSCLDKCDAILSVTPFYNKPSQQGLYEHFKAIAKNSPLPIVLYNVPGRTGVNMQASTTIRLASEIKNIIGLKEASGLFQQATELQKIDREDFSILSGEDALILPLMSIGFNGVISVAAQVCPKGFKEMIKAIKQNDYKTARTLHLKYSELCKILFTEGNPSGIKAALQSAGIIEFSTLRLPLTPVSESLYSKIKIEVQNLL